jgi:hypothetical protein
MPNAQCLQFACPGVNGTVPEVVLASAGGRDLNGLVRASAVCIRVSASVCSGSVKPPFFVAFSLESLFTRLLEASTE